MLVGDGLSDMVRALVVYVCVSHWYAFTSAGCSRAQLLSVLNNFLTCLCVRVAELVDPSDANYTKEVLLSQLPNVKGTTWLG